MGRSYLHGRSLKVQRVKKGRKLSVRVIASGDNPPL